MAGAPIHLDDQRLNLNIIKNISDSCRHTLKKVPGNFIGILGGSGLDKRKASKLSSFIAGRKEYSDFTPIAEPTSYSATDMYGRTKPSPTYAFRLVYTGD